MKTITLSNGHVALVDDIDFETLNKFKWFVKKGYAVRSDHSFTPTKTVRMHRQVLDFFEKGNVKEVHHKNGDKLDNQRHNLEILRNSDHQLTRGLQQNNVSGYKGVSFKAANNKYQAALTYNGTVYYIGLFETAKQAAVAYDNFAIAGGLTTTQLNFPNGTE